MDQLKLNISSLTSVLNEPSRVTGAYLYAFSISLILAIGGAFCAETRTMTCSNKRSSARLDFETKIENHKLVDGAVRANRNKIAFENLSNDQIRQIQGVCGDLMQLFGYAKAGRATVNLYPDWLIEQPISDLINLKMNSQLSQSEQELRSERHRLIDTIISRQIPSPDFL